MSRLREHLNNEHESEISIDQHTFKNMTEFKEWKSQTETATKSHYIRHSSIKMYGQGKHHYYYCNRSGNHELKGHTKRQLKSKAQAKLGQPVQHTLKQSKIWQL